MHFGNDLVPKATESPDDVSFGENWINTFNDQIDSEFLKKCYKAHNQRIIVWISIKYDLLFHHFI